MSPRTNLALLDSASAGRAHKLSAARNNGVRELPYLTMDVLVEVQGGIGDSDTAEEGGSTSGGRRRRRGRAGEQRGVGT